MNNRTQRVLLRSAARTATNATPVSNDYAAKGLRIYVNVTTASGTGGVTLHLRGYDKASGVTADVMVAPVAITATGMYVYEVLEGTVSAVEGNIAHAVSRAIPVVWDINMVHADASTYTYSLSVETTS